MFPVILNSTGENVEFAHFYENLIDICNSHRAENRALVFAIIVYNFHDAHLIKVLRDDDYWRSLHELSGKYISIFSLNNDETNGQPHVNPSEAFESIIQEYFDYELKLSFPGIIFFQVNETNIIDSVFIKLDESEIELSFIELQRYVAKVVNDLKLIERQNYGNIQQIFNNTEGTVEAERFKRISAKKVQQFLPLIRIISSIYKLG